MLARSSLSFGAVFSLFAAASLGCGGGANSTSGSSGGTAGAGGDTGTQTQSETTSSTGGATSTGGSTSTGGAGGETGGSTSTGGAGGSTSTGGTGGSTSTGGMGGGTGGAAPGTHAKLPVAPDASHFMWQGMQTAFLNEDGQPCTASVALAVGDQAVCYAGADRKLRCAGKIYDHNYGASFTVVGGVEDVSQILISPTFNAANHNSICVKAGAGAACMGSNHDQGQFGVGNKNPYLDFVSWGSGLTGIVALATGTWDQICAETTAGNAQCAGLFFGLTPTVADASASTVWIDTFGAAKTDDTSVFRVPNGRTDCRVKELGLVCDVGIMGNPGAVVDGTYTSDFNPPGVPPGGARYCWLESNGVASCNYYSGSIPGSQITKQEVVFNLHPVLMLAGNPYTTSLCAVYDDGSIACLGKNDVAQLGLPAQPYVATPTIVAPPGSIDLDCK